MKAFIIQRLKNALPDIMIFGLLTAIISLIGIILLLVIGDKETAQFFAVSFGIGGLIMLLPPIFVGWLEVKEEAKNTPKQPD